MVCLRVTPLKRLCALLIVLAFLAAPAAAKPTVKKLLKELKSAAGEPQLRVIRSLGRTKKSGAVEPLLALFDIRKDNPKRSAAIVEALGRLGDQKAVNALAGAWDYLDSLKLRTELPPHLQILRGSIIEALGELGGERAGQLAMAALADEDERIVEKAVRALGGIKEKRAIDALIELSTRGGNLSQAVYEALGEIGEARAVPVLEKGLKKEKTLDRIPAAYGLALLGREQGIAALKFFLEPGPDGDKPGILAGYYLARLNKTAGLDYLVMLLDSDGTPVQLLAAEALGKTRNKKAVLPLAEALESADAVLRLTVVRGLGTLGGSRAIVTLKRQRDDPNAAVRGAVKLALADLGEE